MSKPHSGGANEKSDQPEGESAAVRVRTEAASEQDTAETEMTEPVEGKANEPKDAEKTAGSAGTGEADAPASDDAKVDQKSQEVESVKATRRVGWPRARGVKARRGGQGPRGAAKQQSGDADDAADQQDEKSVEGEAKEPSDATTEAGAEDTGEAEAAVSDDVDAAEKDDAEDSEKDDVDVSEQDDAGEKDEAGEPAKAKRRISWSQVVAYGVLPALALLLAGAAGFLKWQDSSARASQIARIESVAAAKDSTIALLSYKADTVEKDLDAGKSRLTGAFRDSYTQLINDVVIPGAKKDHISTTATVPSAASVSATPTHAVVLLFVDQTAVIDKSPPSDTASSVRVTMDKVNGRWLISGFDPV